MAEKKPTVDELEKRIASLESQDGSDAVQRLEELEVAVASAHAAIEQLVNAMQFLLMRQSHPKSPGISLNIDEKKNPDAGMADVE